MATPTYSDSGMDMILPGLPTEIAPGDWLIWLEGERGWVYTDDGWRKLEGQPTEDAQPNSG